MKTNLCRRLIRFFQILLFAAGGFSAHAGPRWDLILTESEWVGPNIIRIPFTLTGTLITVRAQVDTVEGNFFFDTGASGLLLNYRYFDNVNRIASEEAGGVTGRVRVLGATRVDTFQFDNLMATEVDAELIDFRHIENAKKVELVGLIGYSVFKDFEVLFDYEASLLVLIRTDKSGGQLEALPRWEYKPIGNAPVELSEHVAIIWLKFASKQEKKFALDSGAEQNLLSTTSGKRFLKENFEIRRRVKLRGTGNQNIEVLSGILQNAVLDTFKIKPMATLLTDLSEINAAYQSDVDGMLGYEFLKQRPVSINYRKRRITFYVKERP
ncbi:MAG: hypothetical protein OHK0019_29950 [Saprospiraceae bacterium]